MLEDEHEYDAFLNYAEQDKDFCTRLAEALRNRGVRVWFDDWEVKPGANLLDKINRGLER